MAVVVVRRRTERARAAFATGQLLASLAQTAVRQIEGGGAQVGLGDDEQDERA
ncbi:MAG: hypothetical protein KIT11_06780 [Fimbriimonadaceae bacterium]|nr:hypothetical protein [Fimbriimonadaceae bacterium]QYK56058.1 MAG: hypothetical protein KF733_00970 [Fimbriimonadaceae bacterium]